MLYEVLVNDWGETTYVPTLLGKVLLGALIAVILVIAVLIAKKENEKKKAILTVKQLAFCGMAIALGTVLSNIKVFKFPTGGSITLLSMLVITLPGYWFGLIPGILTGIAYGALQLIIDPYVLFPLQLVVDYILAFGALGLAGIFAEKKNGLIFGYITAVIGRYVFAVISGCAFFGMYAWEGWNPLGYSLAYNAIYIPPVKKAMGTLRKMALN